MYNESIIYYSKNPPNKFKLEDYNVEYKEKNELCGDDLNIYIKIEDNKIIDWSFTWDSSIIATACSSIMWESIIWMDIKEILNLNSRYIEELIWQEISNKRKKSSVLALLATRNAIHIFLKDNIKDDFDILIK